MSSQTKIIIHGVPIGHEICGASSKEESDFFRQFYDLKVNVSTVLRIDILEGVSYYTYLKKNNFSNAENRPGSYFGLTVCLGNSLCTNIFTLYSILDTIYNQICVGTLVKIQNGLSNFIVREINSTKYNGYSVLEYISAIFEKNFDKYLLNSIEAINDKRTSANSVKFNLQEVDSPLFIEVSKTKTILVSPEFPSAISAYNSLLDKLKPIEDAYKTTHDENQKLLIVKDELEKQVKSLREENATIIKTSQDESKKELTELYERIEFLKKENDALNQTIKEYRISVNAIDEPLKTLTRLMASRFHCPNEENINFGYEPNRPKNQAKNKKLKWYLLGNTLLLLSIFIIVCLNLFNIKPTLSFSRDKNDAQTEQTVNQQVEVQNNTTQNVIKEVIPCNSNESDSTSKRAIIDKFKSYKINIKGFNEKKDGNALSSSKEYTLEVCKDNWAPANNVHKGTWESNSSYLKINGNRLTVDSHIPGEQDVQIFYTVESNQVLTRNVKAKKGR